MPSRHPPLKLGSIVHAIRRLQGNGTAFASVTDAMKARAASFALSSAGFVCRFIKGSVSPGIIDRTGALVRKARKCKGFADVENFFSMYLISQERILGDIYGHTIGRSQRLGSNVFDRAQDEEMNECMPLGGCQSQNVLCPQDLSTRGGTVRDICECCPSRCL